MLTAFFTGAVGISPSTVWWPVPCVREMIPTVSVRAAVGFLFERRYGFRSLQELVMEPSFVWRLRAPLAWKALQMEISSCSWSLSLWRAIVAKAQIFIKS